MGAGLGSDSQLRCGPIIEPQAIYLVTLAKRVKSVGLSCLSKGEDTCLMRYVYRGP